ncbi:uncharacterized protein LOC119185974 isoform X2 [Rhipicephalus microplus]|uniref:uncharacterized protein LOC119185974 isoform X2 n=1 Tax=Rhipicephalus microplus TaxID=6941 RepID=UPI003F6D964D
MRQRRPLWCELSAAMNHSRGHLLAQLLFAFLFTQVEALQEGNFQAGLNQHATALEVSREIKVGRLYHWLNWSLVRSHHCLYLWSSAAAIELPHISSGSFNFLVNNTLHVLLPTGEVENASGSSNQGMELLRRLQEAQSLVFPPIESEPILSRPGALRLAVANWAVSCRKTNELAIHNGQHPQQVILLRQHLQGLVFYSTRGTRHSFPSKTRLPPEFVRGWLNRCEKHLRSTAEASEKKIASTTRAPKPNREVTVLSGVFMQPKPMESFSKPCKPMEDLARVTTTPKYLLPAEGATTRYTGRTRAGVTTAADARRPLITGDHMRETSEAPTAGIEAKMHTPMRSKSSLPPTDRKGSDTSLSSGCSYSPLPPYVVPDFKTPDFERFRSPLKDCTIHRNPSKGLAMRYDDSSSELDSPVSATIDVKKTVAFPIPDTPAHYTDTPELSGSPEVFTLPVNVNMRRKRATRNVSPLVLPESLPEHLTERLEQEPESDKVDESNDKDDESDESDYGEDTGGATEIPSARAPTVPLFPSPDLAAYRRIIHEEMARCYGAHIVSAVSTADSPASTGDHMRETSEAPTAGIEAKMHTPMRSKSSLPPTDRKGSDTSLSSGCSYSPLPPSVVPDFKTPDFERFRSPSKDCTIHRNPSKGLAMRYDDSSSELDSPVSATIDVKKTVAFPIPDTPAHYTDTPELSGSPEVFTLPVNVNMRRKRATRNVSPLVLPESLPEHLTERLEQEPESDKVDESNDKDDESDESDYGEDTGGATEIPSARAPTVPLFPSPDLAAYRRIIHEEMARCYGAHIVSAVSTADSPASTGDHMRETSEAPTAGIEAKMHTPMRSKSSLPPTDRKGSDTSLSSGCSYSPLPPSVVPDFKTPDFERFRSPFKDCTIHRNPSKGLAMRYDDSSSELDSPVSATIDVKKTVAFPIPDTPAHYTDTPELSGSPEVFTLPVNVKMRRKRATRNVSPLVLPESLPEHLTERLEQEPESDKGDESNGKDDESDESDYGEDTGGATEIPSARAPTVPLFPSPDLAAYRRIIHEEMARCYGAHIVSAVSTADSPASTGEHTSNYRL